MLFAVSTQVRASFIPVGVEIGFDTTQLTSARLSDDCPALITLHPSSADTGKVAAHGEFGRRELMVFGVGLVLGAAACTRRHSVQTRQSRGPARLWRLHSPRAALQ